MSAGENFFARVERTIERELRLAGLVRQRDDPPVLADVDAEVELCSAAMDGRISTIDFLPASDFYSDLFAHVWVACEACRAAGLEATDASVLSALKSSGFSGPALAEEVQKIRLCQPFVSDTGLLNRARRVSELARKRELVTRLEQLGLDLRFGLDLSEARRTLARLSGVE